MNETSGTLEAIELDFVVMNADGTTPTVFDEVRVWDEVHEWLAEADIPVVGVTIVALQGPAGGNPLVRIEGTAEAIDRVTRLYNQ